MRIPDSITNNIDAYQYSGFRGYEPAPETAGSYADGRIGNDTAPEPIDPYSSRRFIPDMPESVDFSKNSKPVYTPDGDILDLDWNRIRRFVQRFAWQTEPPDSVKDIRDFWDKRASAPVFNFDGDRVEFDFGRTQNNEKKTYGNESIDKANIVEPKGECTTCSNRKYVDRSNDSSVSYQTPTKLSPSTAALAVGAHEREHVFNERAKASREGREVVNQTVTIKYAICPECHKMYAAGGVTHTTTVKSGGGGTPQNKPEDDTSSPQTD